MSPETAADNAVRNVTAPVNRAATPFSKAEAYLRLRFALSSKHSKEVAKIISTILRVEVIQTTSDSGTVKAEAVLERKTALK